MILNKQKINFIKNALLVWVTSQLILHVSLLFLSISLSILISNCFYIPMGYYFYGKNVFNVKRIELKSAHKFISFSILLFILNTLATSFVHSNGYNKNISALIILPFLASISYLAQKYFVFRD